MFFYNLDNTIYFNFLCFYFLKKIKFDDFIKIFKDKACLYFKKSVCIDY